MEVTGTVSHERLMWALDELFIEAEKHGVEQMMNQVTLVGGSALTVRRVCEYSEDIDLFIENPTPAMKAAIEEVKNRYQARFGQALEVDTTDNAYIWSNFRLVDADGSQPLDFAQQVTVEHNGREYRVLAMTLPTLFVLKTDSARIKDRDHLALIEPCITPNEIAQVLDGFARLNGTDAMREIVGDVFQEYALLSGRVPEPEWFSEAPEWIREEIGSIYGIQGFDVNEAPGARP